MGTLAAVGGPAGSQVPLPGHVVAVASTGARFAATVGKNGRFSLVVPAGMYYLTGNSRRARSDGADMRCSADHTVRVTVGEVSPRVAVVCPIR